jgi:hypothetical protein
MRKANGAHVWVVEIDKGAGRGFEPYPEAFQTREETRLVTRRWRESYPGDKYRVVPYVRAGADASRQAAQR